MDGLPKLVESPLSQVFEQGGIRVEVDIYRLEEELTWTLEVVDKHNNSIVWDEAFPTDQAALDCFLAEVEEEGLASMVYDESQIIH